MKADDLENELRNLKLIHLSESELADYYDQQLDPIRRARAEAHLKQCFICQRQLSLLREEDAALADPQIKPEDIELVDRILERTGPALKSSTGSSKDSSKRISLQERLAEYLREMLTSWKFRFAEVHRGEDDQVEEVWRWKSEDGRFQARAVIEDTDLIIYLTSPEMELDGARLHFRLGLFNQELTLRRVSESEVAAQVALPWEYRRDLKDISIEIV